MAVKKPVVKAAPAFKGSPAKAPFTMRHLWRMTLWGGTAASALLVAVLASRSDVGSQRVAGLFSGRSDRTQLAAQPSVTQAEARRLAEAVRGLRTENDELKSRLAAVEHNMDDITGSVARQIEAIKNTDANPAPDRSPPAAAPPGSSAVLTEPPAGSAPAPAGTAEPLPSRTVTPAPAPAAAPPSAAVPQYGVDIGSAVSIQVLRAHWLGIRSAHAQLFDGLTPVVMLHELPQPGRVELRLVVGPLANAEAAVRLCAALVPYRLPCQPTPFSGQHVALQ